MYFLCTRVSILCRSATAPDSSLVKLFDVYFGLTPCLDSGDTCSHTSFSCPWSDHCGDSSEGKAAFFLRVVATTTTVSLTANAANERDVSVLS